MRLTRYITLVLAMAGIASCSLQTRLEPSNSLQTGKSALPTAQIAVPKMGSSFQIEIDSYTGNVAADVIEVDPDDVTTEQVRSLRAKGVYPICYVNVGAWEEWRSDSDRFPKEVIGKDNQNLQGVHWLDIGRYRQYFHLMADRIKVCADKGFLAVDADNVDGWQEDTGFKVTSEEGALYVTELAKTAHNHGLAFALRNDIVQLDYLVGDVDMAVVEDCHEGDACENWSVFLKDKKPVFVIEYEDEHFAECKHDPPGMTTVRKTTKLDSWVKDCSGKEQP